MAMREFTIQQFFSYLSCSLQQKCDCSRKAKKNAKSHARIHKWKKNMQHEPTSFFESF